jgi:polyisoprenoid-binding protein YceI
MLRGCFIAVTAASLTTVADEPEQRMRRDAAQAYSIDSARTVVSFEVRSLGTFRQRGWFGSSSGHVTLDPQNGAGTFDVIVDATTVQASSDARLRIIRGASFLNVERFPRIAYEAEHVTFSDGKPIRVDGTLTLLGVTHPVPLKVSGYQCTAPADGNQQRCTMDASAMFTRSEFGMTGSMLLAGDKVRLVIHAEATAVAIDE